MGTFIKKLRKKHGLNKPNWDIKHIKYEKNINFSGHCFNSNMNCSISNSLGILSDMTANLSYAVLA